MGSIGAYLSLSISNPAKAARRIHSDCGSITEILFALGLNDEIAGVTDFCDYPETAAKKPRIGGFANASIEKIVSLKPDLILHEN